MRLATQQAGPVVIDGMTLGVNLGFDFCSEHEWGFKWAQRHLGRPGKATRALTGLAVRTTTRHEPGFRIELHERPDGLWLRGSTFWRDTPDLAMELSDAKRAPMYLGDLQRGFGWSVQRGEGVAAAWDGDSGFCVVGVSEAGKQAVRIAHGALIGDRCFVNQGAGILGRGGLCLIDAEMIPPGVDDEMRAADILALNLEDAVAATGIRERLAKADKRYFALSPRWAAGDAGKITFWLNPMEQDRHNYGWFTLEDLDAWIAGSGPIPMTNAQRQKRARA